MHHVRLARHTWVAPKGVHWPDMGAASPQAIAATIASVGHTGSSEHAPGACSGQQLNIVVHRVPDQGVTRKSMALAHSAANLLTNLRGYCAGRHARLAQSQGNQRKGSQPVGNLIQAGRRLTSINFVTFTLAVQDILKQEITLICLMSEMSSAEAIEVWRAVQDTLVSLSKATQRLEELRRWLFVTVLVGQYMSSADVVILWHSLRYTKVGKNFRDATLFWL